MAGVGLASAHRKFSANDTSVLRAVPRIGNDSVEKCIEAALSSFLLY